MLCNECNVILAIYITLFRCEPTYEKDETYIAKNRMILFERKMKNEKRGTIYQNVYTRNYECDGNMGR